jgi:predicted DNA-binding protein (MmcQ/YjbR family)
VTPPDPIAAARSAIEAQPGAVGASLPAFPSVTVYKIMGKMFAILEDGRVKCVILKCDPHLAETLRDQYEGVGHRSHLDRRFWIAVSLGADVPGEEVERLIAHSHAQVCAKLTRKQRAELAARPAR